MTSLLWFLTLASVASPEVRLPPALSTAVKIYDKAQWSGDRKLLDQSLADDYLLINSAGQAETKATFVSEMTDPAFSMKPFEVMHSVERVWPDGAVLGGVTLLEGTDHGEAFKACLRFSDVWAHRKGRWQVIYTHASRAKAEDCQ